MVPKFNLSLRTVFFMATGFLLLSAFSSQTLYANEPFWKLASEGMTRASAGVMAGVVLVFATLIGGLIVMHIYSEKKMKKTKAWINAKKFDNYCEDFFITKGEKEFLAQVIQSCGVDDVDPIFLELHFFETKVDEFIKTHYNTIDPLFWQRYTEDASLRVFNDDGVKIVNSLRDKLDFTFKMQKMPLVTTRQISIGQRLYIRTDSIARGVETSVRENNIFYIRAIKVGEHSLNFKDGERADIFFDRDGQYKFTTTIVESNEAGLSFLQGEKLIRTQHRNDVRYELRLPATFKILHRRNAVDKLYCKENEGTILDISGGGIRFSSKSEVLVNDEIMLKAVWDDVELKFKVNVLRTSVITAKKETVYVGFCRYSDIDKLLKEKIIKKIFESIRNELKTYY